jgi:hypothetical protein
VSALASRPRRRRPRAVRRERFPRRRVACHAFCRVPEGARDLGRLFVRVDHCEQLERACCVTDPGAIVLRLGHPSPVRSVITNVTPDPSARVWTRHTAVPPQPAVGHGFVDPTLGFGRICHLPFRGLRQLATSKLGLRGVVIDQIRAVRVAEMPQPRNARPRTASVPSCRMASSVAVSGGDVAVAGRS